MNKSSKRSGRDTSRIARVSLSRPRYTPQPSFLSPTLPYSYNTPPARLLDDRRLFHFDRAARPAVAFQRVATRLSVAPRNPMYSIKFEQPQAVSICDRRSRRKEVLFAIKKNGRNGGRNYKRNTFSNVGC